MNKEVRFTGYTAVPSDYDSPDGQLAQSFNLLNETGSLQPLFPPKVIRILGDKEVVCIHKAGGHRFLIMFEPSSGNILSLSDDDGAHSATPLVIGTGFTEKPCIAPVGNTLVASSSDKTSYFLYSADKQCHVCLGDTIPEPTISFALSHRRDTDNPLGDNYSGTLALDTEGIATEEIEKILTGITHTSHPVNRPGSVTGRDILIMNITNAVLAFLNKMNAEATEENKFIHPFFVRWALRLYDGSYIRQSAPVLMVPNSLMSPIRYSKPSSGDALLNIPVECAARRCTLMFRPTGITPLAGWSDIVKSIDFFVSLPVYTYDQAGKVVVSHRTGETRQIFSHSGVAVRDNVTRSENENNHRPPAVLDPDSVQLYNFTDGNKEDWFNPPTMALLPPVFTREHIESGITSVSSFYRVASLPLTGEDCIRDLDSFTPLSLDDSSLTTLATHPTLPDDWRSHDNIFFRSAYPYNSRLALSGIKSAIFPGFPLPAMSQYNYEPKKGDIACMVWTKTVRESQTCWVSTRSVLPSGMLPRFLFYPDPSAVEIRIILADGSGWRLPLKTHDFLSGAYWFDGLSEERTPKDESIPEPDMTATTAEEPSKVFLSEVNNPFYFPVVNRVTVGTGRIIGICSAAKALSQGQFGQFPLYAFTDEGIWALEISSSGGFSARQPITRDVCTSADSITQIDSAVLFATDRGIMLISGSQTQCISDPLNAPDFLDFNTLPWLCDKFPEFAHPDCLFTDYIRNCRMAYDYVNQRIVLFNPDKRYSYVYSLRTKLWGIQASNLTRAVNSYPEALVMARRKEDGKDCNLLVDLSSTEADTVRCLLVTRPLKFDSPDILKTISTLIQRGLLPKAKTQTGTILYGTRDYRTWHLVASSQGISCRTYLGTPYKAFRLVSVATLAKGETIAGASFEVTPRFTNRLR